MDVILQRRQCPQSQAMKWGLDNERLAKQHYLEYMQKCHTNFRLCDVGFVIDPVVCGLICLLEAKGAGAKTECITAFVHFREKLGVYIKTLYLKFGLLHEISHLANKIRESVE